LATAYEGRMKVTLRKEATMGILWTVLAVIGLIVVLQYIF
jgi:hypothetical protein